MADPIAPPQMIETVTPGVGTRPVANITLDYPPRFAEIVKDVQQAESPDARLRIADNVAAHDTESKEYRPNQKTQWDKVLVNILSRNYNEALKWYNGGGVKEEKAVDALGNLFYKETNDLGFTGQIKDANGKYLTPAQRDALFKRGGIITGNDQDAIQTAGWSNSQNISKLAAQGLANPLRLAQADAYQAARTAGSANDNIDEQLKLSTGLSGVLDHIATLPPERRQKILGYVNRLNQINTSKGTTTEKGMSGTAGGQSTVGNTAGVQGSVGAGKAGAEGAGIAPPGMGISAGGSLGASGSATSYGSATGREASTAQASRAALDQESQTLQSAIMEELQGVIKSGQQFSDFMRLQALNAANDQSYKEIPEHVKPPTWRDVSDTDPLMGGSKAMQVNRINQQRNNALMAAWSKELYKAQRKAAQSGESTDLQELADNFQKSQIFEAINNTYGAKMKSFETGVRVLPPKGALMVNKRNEIGRSPGE